EAVDERDIGGLAGPERLAQAAQVALVQSVAIDYRCRKDANRDPLCATHDRPVELVAGLWVDLLRVVQERERPDAMVGEAFVVEQHARDDERPRQRPAARPAGAGDEPPAERPVEPEQLLACARLRSHGASGASPAAGDPPENAECAEKLRSC